MGWEELLFALAGTVLGVAGDRAFIKIGSRRNHTQKQRAGDNSTQTQVGGSMNAETSKSPRRKKDNG
jgi:hypothetical protein